MRKYICRTCKVNPGEHIQSAPDFTYCNNCVMWARCEHCEEPLPGKFQPRHTGPGPTCARCDWALHTSSSQEEYQEKLKEVKTPAKEKAWAEEVQKIYEKYHQERKKKRKED